MSHAVNWSDRLRIEFVVWALDQRLYDLPRKSRVATRREVRENLLVAARDIGSRDALNRLGQSRELAAAYRSAEFGERKRPYWVAAAAFAISSQLLFTWLLAEAASAFRAGVTAGIPRPAGTYTWGGIRYLQDTITFTFVHGEAHSLGGAWTPLSYAIWIALVVLVGRLWRAIPAR